VLAAGQSLVIAGHRPHGVEALEDSVVLDVFAPRREDWIRGDDAYLRVARSRSGRRRCGPHGDPSS